MRSRLFPLALPVVAVLALSTLPIRAAQVPNRITAAISGSSRLALEHAVPIKALRSSDLGAAPGDRALTSLTVRFSLTAAQQADLTQLLANQQNLNSPNYHQWLTPEQFGARFGLSTADLGKVSAWLTSQGFKITSTARSSTFITFSGTVAQAEQAFGTSIHSLSYNGEKHISNLTNPISGLSDFKVKPRLHKTAVKVNADYTATGAACISGSGTCYYIAPGDFYTIYDVNPLLSSSINGQGISIAVVGQSDISTAEVTAFRATSGLSSTLPTVVEATGYTPGEVEGDVDEAQLDVEWAGAGAPNATIKFVTVGASESASVFDALSYTVDNNIAPIISSSYGECESLESTSMLNSINQTLAQANAEGETEVNASGDSGATDCDTSGLASEGLAVDFPSSSPYATAAGGTMFSGDVNNPTQYWNSSNSSNGTGQYTSSVKSYIPESPWNEANSSTGLTAGGSGGGGASAFFSKPAWQVGTGVPLDGSRDVPDISLNAGAIHDGTIVCSIGDCTSGYAAGGIIDVFGGTSVATPTFAGMLALLEQKLISENVLTSGQGLGNIGGKLYGLANIANVYHDITSGNNSIYCIQGTPNCPNGGSIGFAAGVGYDQATGLGSVDAANFVNNWTAAVATGTGSTTGTAISTTTLTTTNATCGNSGSIPFSVTVASGGSSTATPTGTVQLYVDNVAVTSAGSSAQLNGGTVQLTLITSGLSSGSHNVSVLYSGDATFAGSKGALLTNTANTFIVTQIDVVSTTSPDFSMTPCLQTINNVVTGTSAGAVTLSITPANGFTGPVSFTANSDTGDLLGYAFSVNPVTVSGSAATTVSFVLTATEPASSAAAKKLKVPFSHHPTGKTPWYAAGSGATLACLLLIAVPKRRRWGTLLALLLSVAVITASGCSSSSSTTGGGGGGGGGGGSTTTPVSPGTYNITVTATSGSLVHSIVLTYNIVQ
jgi:subtilase family serine protease